MDSKTQLFFFIFTAKHVPQLAVYIWPEEMTTATIDKQLAKKPAQNPLLCALAQHKVDI